MDVSALELTSSKYLNALIIFIFFLLLAKITDYTITKFGRKAVEKTKWEIDDRIIDYFHLPLFLTVLIMGLLAILYYLSFSERIEFYAAAALESFAVIVWAVALFRLTAVVVQSLPSRIFAFTGIEKELIPLFENIAKVVVLVGAIMIILSAWEKDITPLIASAGIVGFAVAFAAKDTISNFFGGINVFMDKPYKIGDYVILDTGDRGEVVDIGLRSTKILTRDEVFISIPNSIMANSKIINESAPQPRFRVRIPVGVAYGSDVERVEEVLIEVALANENVVKEPEPRARFRRFGDSALEFELLVWVGDPRYKGRTIHALNREINRRFAEEGIVVPFPQRDVHLMKG